MNNTLVTLKQGGTGEKTVPISEVEIPDLWHIARALESLGHLQASEAVLTVWHNCHDLKRHIQESK